MLSDENLTLPFDLPTEPIVAQPIHRGFAMPELKVGEMTLEVDEKGFLQEPERWDDDVAAALAATEGVDALTAEHWKLVRYLRQHYLVHGLAPMVRKLCKQTGLKLKRVYELFPSGPAKGACKVAGMPNADGCV